MLKIETPPQYMDIIQHPNNFYEFTFKAGSSPRLAFDEWIIYVEQLYQMPKGTPVKLLTNNQNIEAIPLAYAFRKSQPIIKRNPIRAKIRTVLLFPESQGILEKLLHSFIEILALGDEIRYMYGDSRDEAIQWLFANEPELTPITHI